MPTFNNYRFFNVTYIVPENSNVSALYPTAVITIMPETGYVLDAGNFSLNPTTTYPEIQSVVFTQSGQNVICTVTFNTGFEMPSNNLDIFLCIIGEGTVAPIHIEGLLSAAVGGDVSGDGPEINTIYANSGSFLENELLFTRTYTADSGYYLDPSIQITNGNQANYTIEQLPTYDIEGNLISITYNVRYRYPDYSVFSDSIYIKVSAQEIYVAPQTVTSYVFDTSNIYPIGEIRNILIYGSPGAVFSLIMNDSSSNVYNIVIDGVIDSTGLYTAQVVFPDITDGIINEYYEIVLSGDIDPNFAQPTTIEVLQNIAQPTITITASSSTGITGFTPVSTQGNSFDFPSSLFITADWTLTSSTGDINYLGYTDITNFKFTQQTATMPIVASTVVNSSTVTLTNATGVQIGDRFNTFGQASAPFSHEVTNVSGNTLTVSPVITAAAGSPIFTYRTNGNIIENPIVTATQVDPSTINLSLNVQVYAFGDDDITFTLDLDEIIEYATIPIPCSSVATSGATGVTDFSTPLDPAGGLLAFLVTSYSIPDKFEIIHGGGAGTKKATSSMIAGENYGPFDNVYGTTPSDIIPTPSETVTVDQFIGTDKPGTIPTNQTEFTTDIGWTIPTMTVGGTTYQQVIWWEYTPTDYDASPLAKLRVTGAAGTTGWQVLRLCCPDSNCIPS
jgi:hypothetical protein